MTTKDHLKSNDQDLVRFRLAYISEYLRVGQLIALREGRSKMFGVITRLITDQELDLEKTVLK
jgi:GTPase